MNRLATIILAGMLSLASWANGNILTERYNLSYINLDNGLPHNNVSWLYSDSNGFLWIATYGGGLVRYDGYGMMMPMLGLNSLSCKAMTEDRFKRLWVAFDEGTNVIDLNTMLPIVPKTTKGDISELLAQPSVKTYCDALGRIWLITTKYVNLISFDEYGGISNVVTYQYTDNTPDISICDIEGNGKPWICIDRGLYRMAEKDGKLVREEISSLLKPLYGLYITDMLKRGNVVWFSTNHGLYRYDPYLHKLDQIPVQSLSHEFLSRLALMPDNTLLVGSLCGVNIYDDQTDTFTAWTQASNPPLKNDFVHNLWVDNGLVVRLVPRQLLLQNSVHTSDPGSLSPNPVNAMYASADGTLWVGTVEGGLNRRPKGERNFIHYTKSNSSLPHNSVSTLAADKYGRLWIGTWGGGLCWINMSDPGAIVHLELSVDQARLTNFIGAMAYDPINDGMWIGSNDGLFFYDFKKKQLIEPFEECQLVRGCIGSIVTKDGYLWMGCMQGVVVVDLKSQKNGRFETRNIRHLLADPTSKIVDKISSFCETRKGIVEDRNGRLWITTQNGLSVYDPKLKAFTNYSQHDGLISPHFYWNSAIKDAAGNICLGSEAGLIEMLGENADTHYHGHLTFTHLMVDNQDAIAGSDYLKEDITMAKTIWLKEGHRSFSIDFSALDYGYEMQGVYSYRMKGFDNDWEVLKPGEHSVRYSSLPAGTYTFEVNYKSTQTAGDGDTISVEVVVKPYFWRSWWFRLLLGILFVALLVYIYNRWVAVVKRKEAEQLLTPIRRVLEESEDPRQLQSRIQNILDNQQRYKQSVTKSVEADKEEVMKSSKPFMERVMEIMEAHSMDSEFGVQEFCDALGMSRTVASKHLNAEAGLPVGQFIRNYRLNMAKEMLSSKTGNRNITEIAYAVGFNDPKYFTRCFTKLYGTNPSSWS